MCNNSSNNILIIGTTISMWIYNNFSQDTINCLANLLQIVGQNLSSMQALEIVNTVQDNENKKIVD